MVGATREDVERAFRDMIKSLRCPACEVEFSDAAADFGDAWSEGRRDALREHGMEERDGPFKLKCELCGRRSWLNYFARTVELIAEDPDER